jgi:hypothetical protein
MIIADSGFWIALADKNDKHHTKADAVAKAYGWDDYTPEMPDAEILQRLLKLNLSRSTQAPDLNVTPESDSTAANGEGKAKNKTARKTKNV